MRFGSFQSRVFELSAAPEKKSKDALEAKGDLRGSLRGRLSDGFQ